MTTELFDPLELVHLVALAVLDMHQHHDTGYSVPYPPAAQVALDRMVLACLIGGGEAPKSVPDLMTMCRQPLSKWPIEVPPDFAGPEARFIDKSTDRPTRTCLEWAFHARRRSTAADQGNALGVLARDCPSTQAYERCRDFLIDNPVVSRDDLRRLLAKPGAPGTWKRVSRFYGEFPPDYVINGYWTPCPTCGCPSTASRQERARCESELCPQFTVSRVLPAADSSALSVELRTLLCSPGRVERDIRAVCAEEGGRIELVLAPVDHLRITWESGAVWSLVVGADAEPALLARRLAAWTPLGSERAIVAVPDAVVGRRADYTAVFERHWTAHQVELLPVSRVVTEDCIRTDNGGRSRA